MEHFKTSYDAASQYARQISRKLQQNSDDNDGVDNEIISDVLKLAKRVSKKCSQTARYGRRQSIQAFRMVTGSDPYSRAQSSTTENSQREPKPKAWNAKNTDSERQSKHYNESDRVVEFDRGSEELFSRVTSPDYIEAAHVPTRYQEQQQQQQQQQQQRQVQLPSLQLPPPPLPKPLPQPLLPWTSSTPQPLPQHQTPHPHTPLTPMSLFDYPPPPPPHALLPPISPHPPPPPLRQQLPLTLPMTQNPPETPQTMPQPQPQTHYHIHNTHTPTLPLAPRSDKQVQFPMESTTHQTSPQRPQQLCCHAPQTTINITHEEDPRMTCKMSCQQNNIAAEKTQTATVSPPTCCASSSKPTPSRAPKRLPGRRCVEKAVYRKLFHLMTHHETCNKCGDNLRHSPCTTTHTTPGLGSGCSCVNQSVCEDHHHDCDMTTNIHQCPSSPCHQEAALLPPMDPHHHPDQRPPTCTAVSCQCQETLAGCRQHTTTCCESCQTQTTEDSNAWFEQQQQQKCFPGITNKVKNYSRVPPCKLKHQKQHTDICKNTATQSPSWNTTRSEGCCCQQQLKSIEIETIGPDDRGHLQQIQTQEFKTIQFSIQKKNNKRKPVCLNVNINQLLNVLKPQVIKRQTHITSADCRLKDKDVQTTKSKSSLKPYSRVVGCQYRSKTEGHIQGCQYRSKTEGHIQGGNACESTQSVIREQTCQCISVCRNSAVQNKNNPYKNSTVQNQNSPCVHQCQDRLPRRQTRERKRGRKSSPFTCTGVNYESLVGKQNSIRNAHREEDNKCDNTILQRSQNLLRDQMKKEVLTHINKYDTQLQVRQNLVPRQPTRLADVRKSNDVNNGPSSVQHCNRDRQREVNSSKHQTQRRHCQKEIRTISPDYPCNCPGVRDFSKRPLTSHSDAKCHGSCVDPVEYKNKTSSSGKVPCNSSTINNSVGPCQKTNDDTDNFPRICQENRKFNRAVNVPKNRKRCEKKLDPVKRELPIYNRSTQKESQLPYPSHNRSDKGIGITRHESPNKLLTLPTTTVHLSTYPTSPNNVIYCEYRPKEASRRENELNNSIERTTKAMKDSTHKPTRCGFANEEVKPTTHKGRAHSPTTSRPECDGSNRRWQNNRDAFPNKTSANFRDDVTGEVIHSKHISENNPRFRNRRNDNSQHLLKPGREKLKHSALKHQSDDLNHAKRKLVTDDGALRFPANLSAQFFSKSVAFKEGVNRHRISYKDTQHGEGVNHSDRQNISYKGIQHAPRVDKHRSNTFTMDERPERSSRYPNLPAAGTSKHFKVLDANTSRLMSTTTEESAKNCSRSGTDISSVEHNTSAHLTSLDISGAFTQSEDMLRVNNTQLDTDTDTLSGNEDKAFKNTKSELSKQTVSKDKIPKGSKLMSEFDATVTETVTCTCTSQGVKWSGDDPRMCSISASSISERWNEHNAQNAWTISNENHADENEYETKSAGVCDCDTDAEYYDNDDDDEYDEYYDHDDYSMEDATFTCTCHDSISSRQSESSTASEEQLEGQNMKLDNARSELITGLEKVPSQHERPKCNVVSHVRKIVVSQTFQGENGVDEKDDLETAMEQVGTPPSLSLSMDEMSIDQMSIDQMSMDQMDRRNNVSDLLDKACMACMSSVYGKCVKKEQSKRFSHPVTPPTHDSAYADIADTVGNRSGISISSSDDICSNADILSRPMARMDDGTDRDKHKHKAVLASLILNRLLQNSHKDIGGECALNEGSGIKDVGKRKAHGVTTTNFSPCQTPCEKCGASRDETNTSTTCHWITTCCNEHGHGNTPRHQCEKHSSTSTPSLEVNEASYSQLIAKEENQDDPNTTNQCLRSGLFMESGTPSDAPKKHFIPGANTDEGISFCYQEQEHEEDTMKRIKRNMYAYLYHRAFERNPPAKYADNQKRVHDDGAMEDNGNIMGNTGWEQKSATHPHPDVSSPDESYGDRASVTGAVKANPQRGNDALRSSCSSNSLENVPVSPSMSGMTVTCTTPRDVTEQPNIESYHSVKQPNSGSYHSVKQPNNGSYHSVKQPNSGSYHSVKQPNNGSYHSVKQPNNGSYHSVKQPNNGSYHSVKQPNNGSYHSVKQPNNGSYHSVKQPNNGSYHSVKQPNSGSYYSVSCKQQRRSKTSSPRPKSSLRKFIDKNIIYSWKKQSPKSSSSKSIEDQCYSDEKLPLTSTVLPCRKCIRHRERTVLASRMANASSSTASERSITDNQTSDTTGVHSKITANNDDPIVNDESEIGHSRDDKRDVKMRRKPCVACPKRSVAKKSDARIQDRETVICIKRESGATSYRCCMANGQCTTIICGEDNTTSDENGKWSTDDKQSERQPNLNSSTPLVRNVKRNQESMFDDISLKLKCSKSNTCVLDNRTQCAASPPPLVNTRRRVSHLQQGNAEELSVAGLPDLCASSLSNTTTSSDRSGLNEANESPTECLVCPSQRKGCILKKDEPCLGKSNISECLVCPPQRKGYAQKKEETCLGKSNISECLVCPPQRKGCAQKKENPCLGKSNISEGSSENDQCKEADLTLTSITLSSDINTYDVSDLDQGNTEELSVAGLPDLCASFSSNTTTSSDRSGLNKANESPNELSKILCENSDSRTSDENQPETCRGNFPRYGMETVLMAQYPASSECTKTWHTGSSEACQRFGTKQPYEYESEHPGSKVNKTPCLSCPKRAMKKKCVAEDIQRSRRVMCVKRESCGDVYRCGVDGDCKESPHIPCHKNEDCLVCPPPPQRKGCTQEKDEPYVAKSDISEGKAENNQCKEAAPDKTVDNESTASNAASQSGFGDEYCKGKRGGDKKPKRDWDVCRSVEDKHKDPTQRETNVGDLTLSSITLSSDVNIYDVADNFDINAKPNTVTKQRTNDRNDTMSRNETQMHECRDNNVGPSMQRRLTAAASPCKTKRCRQRSCDGKKPPISSSSGIQTSFYKSPRNEYPRRCAETKPKNKEYPRRCAETKPTNKEYPRRCAETKSTNKEYHRRGAETMPTNNEYPKRGAETMPTNKEYHRRCAETKPTNEKCVKSNTSKSNTKVPTKFPFFHRRIWSSVFFRNRRASRDSCSQIDCSRYGNAKDVKERRRSLSQRPSWRQKRQISKGGPCIPQQDRGRKVQMSRYRDGRDSGMPCPCRAMSVGTLPCASGWKRTLENPFGERKSCVDNKNNKSNFIWKDSHRHYGCDSRHKDRSPRCSNIPQSTCHCEGAFPLRLSRDDDCSCVKMCSDCESYGLDGVSLRRFIPKRNNGASLAECPWTPCYSRCGGKCRDWSLPLCACRYQEKQPRSKCCKVCAQQKSSIDLQKVSNSFFVKDLCTLCHGQHLNRACQPYGTRGTDYRDWSGTENALEKKKNIPQESYPIHSAACQLDSYEGFLEQRDAYPRKSNSHGNTKALFKSIHQRCHILRNVLASSALQIKGKAARQKAKSVLKLPLLKKLKKCSKEPCKTK